MRQSIPVTAFNLDTLERTDFASMARAADHCQVNKSVLSVYMRKDQMWRGWYWCPTDVADLRTDRVLYLSRRWKAKCRPVGCGSGKPELVPLRINSYTVIFVKPEKATPEYAEQYRQKIQKNSHK